MSERAEEDVSAALSEGNVKKFQSIGTVREIQDFAPWPFSV